MKRGLFYLLLFVVLGNTTVAQFKNVIKENGVDHHHHTSLLIGGGAAFFDYNNDGWLDLYVTGGFEADRLYQNDSKGGFIDVSEGSNIAFFTRNPYTFGLTYGDINNDGCQDLFIYTYDKSVKNILLLNNCEGRFINITNPSLITQASSSSGAAFIDYNRDSFLDLYVTNYIDEFIFIKDENGVVVDMERYCLPNFFYKNNGDLTFQELSKELSLNDEGCGLSVLATDYDLDGDQDIYLANDHGQFVLPNMIFENRNSSMVGKPGNGLDIGIYSMGIGAGDYDTDGDMDYYVTNIGENAMLRNDNGTYTRVEKSLQIDNPGYADGTKTTGWGANLFDYDNDADLDLFVSNGYIGTGFLDVKTSLLDSNKFYINSDGKFIDRTDEYDLTMPAINRGSITGDYDNDGDLDLYVVTISEGEEKSGFYENITNNNNHFLKVKLEGTQSNRNAFGTILKAYVGGKVLLRECSSGGSHASQSADEIHFGLSNHLIVDSLTIRWPNGLIERFKNLPVNEFLYFKEGDGAYEILGCMDANNPRFNPNATMSYACEYEIVYGCTVRSSLNYNVKANAIDGSCSDLPNFNVLSLNSRDRYSLYPNPATDYVTLRFANDNVERKISILKLNGQLLESYISSKSSVLLNIMNYRSGLYIIRIREGTDSYNANLMVK